MSQKSSPVKCARCGKRAFVTFVSKELASPELPRAYFAVHCRDFCGTFDAPNITSASKRDLAVLRWNKRQVRIARAIKKAREA